ncbi:MAG: isocitrate/isopropylmalate family dehydrogenase [Kofleriaceae bacterium]
MTLTCTGWGLAPRPRPAHEVRKLVALGGDGIGPEVVGAAVKVLRATDAPIDISEPAHGGPHGFPTEARALCDAADAVLFGAAEVASVPILRYLRWSRGVFANLRPSAPIVPSAATTPCNLVIVRELSEGLYPAREGDLAELAQRWPEYRDRLARPLPADGKFAIRVVTEVASRRIGRFAAQLAAHRKATGTGPGHVTIVTKANVLRETDGMFRECCEAELRAVDPGLGIDHLYVDEAARRLVRSAATFDVIVTTNLFGDILSDVAGEVAGGLPLAPSSGIGETFAYFEPVHGTAPDLAGREVANPIGAIVSGAMALQHLDCSDAADRIMRAIAATLERGVRTRDLGGTADTARFTDAVCQAL